MPALFELVKSVLNKYLNSDKGTYVAYSGGVDSHVLLHLCTTQIPNKEKIFAVYVHHGLQEEADHWAEHCAIKARNLGVGFIQLNVNGQPGSGESPEAAARDARYQALLKLVDTDDVLLTGQHREDQLETILLQLFRGAGLSGLAGMPEVAAFGKGKIIRPLLNISGAVIKDYAKQHHLAWVEDPSNKNCAYDRNYLRNRVIPLLKERWPAIDKTVARSGKHCADAQQHLACITHDLFQGVFNREDQTLSIERLQQYHRYDRQQIIREWFQEFDLRMPSTGVVDKLLDDVIAARQDAAPKLRCKEYVIRRYRDKLYLLSDSQTVNSDSVMQWPENTLQLCLPNNGRLWVTATAAAGISQEVWSKAQIAVRYRQGGESLSLPGRAGNHTLKKLFQEAGIPPWIRKIMPLIYIDGCLAAVGDKWVSAEFYTPHYGKNLQLHWQQMDSLLKDHDESKRVD